MRITIFFGKIPMMFKFRTIEMVCPFVYFSQWSFIENEP